MINTIPFTPDKSELPVAPSVVVFVCPPRKRNNFFYPYAFFCEWACWGHTLQDELHISKLVVRAGVNP